MLDSKSCWYRSEGYSTRQGPRQKQIPRCTPLRDDKVRRKAKAESRSLAGSRFGMTTQAERQKPFDSLRSLRTTILVGLSQIPRSDIAFGTQKARCAPLRDDKKRRNAI